MKVLSMTQPWATLVAIGAKKIETRSWATKYRGPLAIAASKGFPKEARLAWAFSPPIHHALEDAGCRQLEDLPFGSILCVCDLVDCTPIDFDNAPFEPERSFGNYTPGRWAWHLANVRALPEPIPARGSHRLWTPAPDVLEQLERFHREAM